MTIGEVLVLHFLPTKSRTGRSGNANIVITLLLAGVVNFRFFVRAAVQVIQF